MADENKRINAAGVLKTLIVVLIILALTATTFFAFNYYVSLGQARLLLTEAKAAQLAVWSVSMEKEATGARLSDVSRKSGMTDESSEKVKALCQLNGEIFLRQTTKSGYGIQWLTYEKNSYIVEYTDFEGEEQWSVYKKEVLITP